MAHAADIQLDMDFDRETISGMSPVFRSSSGGRVELHGHVAVVAAPERVAKRGSMGQGDTPWSSAPSFIPPWVCAFSKPPSRGSHRSGRPFPGRSTRGLTRSCPRGHIPGS